MEALEDIGVDLDLGDHFEVVVAEEASFVEEVVHVRDGEKIMLDLTMGIVPPKKKIQF